MNKGGNWPPLFLRLQGSQPFHASLLPVIHSLGKPGGGQVAGDLGALELNAGQDGAGLPLAGLLVGQGKNPVIEVGLGKFGGIPFAQALVDRLLAHIDPTGEGIDSLLSLARQV